MRAAITGLGVALGLATMAPAPGGWSRADGRDPDPALRSRPVVGTEIVSGLRETSPGFWTGGRLHNPDDGRTYAGMAQDR